MNSKAAQILKVDAAGRVWTPREQREAVLDEFERSGMPGTKFAERIGVKHSTFAGWVQRRRKRRAGRDASVARDQEPAALKWVEAAVGVADAALGLVVHLPGGARMEVGGVSQAVLAATLLRALAAEARPC